MKYSDSELLLLDPIEVYKLKLNGVIDKFPYGYFKDDAFVNTDVGIVLTKYLIEDILKWDDTQICKKLAASTFKENDLEGMLLIIFNGSPYEALEATYPSKFKPWQLSQTPRGYWTIENGIAATKWLLEDVLKWDDTQICNKLTVKTFKENGLYSMLTYSFDGSPYKAIEASYPGRFKPWQLSRAYKNIWNKENGIAATKWLLEDVLKWDDTQICSKLRVSTFKENGLGGMLSLIFNSSPYEALEAVYPGKFIKNGKGGYTVK